MPEDEVADRPTTSTAPNPDSPPDLAALLKFRPSKPMNPYSKHYPGKYKQLYSRLNNAFVRSQVIKLGNDLLESVNLEQEMNSTPFDAGTASGEEQLAHTTSRSTSPARAKPRKQLPPKASKQRAITVILEEWGWPSPDDVEKQRKRDEVMNAVNETSVELSPAEAFLISRGER
jgi:hypothetical protein